MRTLLGALGAALVVFVFWGSDLYPATLGLVPSRAFGELELWRLFTAPLWLGSLEKVRIAPFFLTLLCLAALGTPLERWLGTGRFLTLFVTSALLGHLGAALLGHALSPHEAMGGPAPGAWAVVTALCINYWSHQIHVIRPLPIRGRHLLWGLAIALLIALLLDWKDGLSLLPFVADGLGGLVGALFVTKGWRLWRRRPKVRSRFVLLQGGERRPEDTSSRPGRKGNGRGQAKDGPKTWN